MVFWEVVITAAWTIVDARLLCLHTKPSTKCLDASGFRAVVVAALVIVMNMMIIMIVVMVNTFVLSPINYSHQIIVLTTMIVGIPTSHVASSRTSS